ncbi:MAG: hypothetical protein WC444_06950 [Candidatus Paceibacterota bacterium]
MSDYAEVDPLDTLFALDDSVLRDVAVFYDLKLYSLCMLKYERQHKTKLWNDIRPKIMRIFLR